MANIIVIKGAGEKAFCAGGDVASLAEANKTGPEGQAASTEFFAKEYQLDHLIATYSKPYVAFLDGVTMGGGVGLSVHAPFRVATERTLFAMPETTIGFFPDVGGSFFLPRLDGELGTYLALTSDRLEGVHAMYAGIATHYLHSSSLPDLEARLAELTFTDSATIDERNQIVNDTIEEFVTGLPENEEFTLSGPTREAIDRCFSFDTIEAIVAALERESSPWATKTLETLISRSPTSVRVALRQLRLGREWSIDYAFQREFLIASRFMKHPDFVEGVEAKLVEKRDPKWDPATLEETTDAMVDEFFTIPEGGWRLPLLKQGADDYTQYPHERFGLPSENAIRSIVKRKMVTDRQLVEMFVDDAAGKAGVKRKVWEVIGRKMVKDEGGYLSWKE